MSMGLAVPRFPRSSGRRSLASNAGRGKKQPSSRQVKQKRTHFLITADWIFFVSTFWLNSGGNFVARSSFLCASVVMELMV